MTDILLQVLGLAILFGGLWLGYRLWIKPHAAQLDMQGRGLMLLVLLTLMGGFIGAPFWWLDLKQSYSWILPPLASRMLASAAWAFAVLSFLALIHPTRQRLRLVLIMLFVYLAPLALVIVLFHLNRFDPAAPISYVFFIIVGVMVLGSGWYLLRQPATITGHKHGLQPPAPMLRGWLLVLAAISGVWGLALFITDSGPSSLIWVWRGDLLSSRLIGVMLLAIAAGALYAQRYADTGRMMLAGALVYGLGLAAAGLWNSLAGKPIPLSYVGVFGAVALISAALLLVMRNMAPPSDAAPQNLTLG